MTSKQHHPPSKAARKQASNPMTPSRKNRTGIAASPIDAKDVMAQARASHITPQADVEIGGVRALYDAEPVPMGTMPLPATLKGMGKTALSALKGENLAVLMDKVGERLAFERTGTRLYEAVIGKLDARGSWEGGPTREALVHILEEELEHFHVLRESMEELGGDPTAMTPSANVTDVVSSGIPQVVTDGRSTLAQCLCAIHVAELADNDGWRMLVSLCTSLGLDSLARRFQACAAQEQDHLDKVRGWLSAHTTATARGAAVEPGIHTTH